MWKANYNRLLDIWIIQVPVSMIAATEILVEVLYQQQQTLKLLRQQQLKVMLA